MCVYIQFVHTLRKRSKAMKNAWNSGFDEMSYDIDNRCVEHYVGPYSIENSCNY